jgi:hypothetical protein
MDRRQTNTYDALIEDRRAAPGEALRRRDAERLAERARNLETLGQLAEAEAKEREREASPPGRPEGGER